MIFDELTFGDLFRVHHSARSTVFCRIIWRKMLDDDDHYLFAANAAEVDGKGRVTQTLVHFTPDKIVFPIRSRKTILGGFKIKKAEDVAGSGGACFLLELG